jgi:hypothetical protein
MAHTFDFSSLEQPVLEVTFNDEAHTKVCLTVPTTELVEKFITFSEEMKDLTKNPDGSLIKSIFGLWADLFNCNTAGMHFTAEDLRDKYGLKLVHLILFQPKYLDFIAEIQNAKN